MNIDWITILTHFISFILGVSGGIAFTSYKYVNKTKGNHSPIYANQGDFIINDLGDNNEDK